MAVGMSIIRHPVAQELSCGMCWSISGGNDCCSPTAVGNVVVCVHVSQLWAEVLCVAIKL